LNFTELQGPKKLQNLFVGSFVIMKLHEKNAVEVQLKPEFERKHPVFPVALFKKFNSPQLDSFKRTSGPSRPVPVVVIPSEKEKSEVLEETIVRENNNNTRLYLVRYKMMGAYADEWLPAEKVPNAKVALRAYRAKKRGNTTQELV
ncbi:hypothetical protein CROQUDRAFT_39634, partial [Cronartium quercuum f. sp. fusiforme G11]